MSATRMASVGSKIFKNVILGGTFDGIHSGHKVLFAEAIKVCSENLYVGVTDKNMIKRKVLWELIAPVEERMINVENYLKSVKPSLTYHVFPISDLYGPTTTNKELECIVVSEETVGGADKINEARESKNWRKLDVVSVKLLQEDDIDLRDSMTRLDEKKVSSSIERLSKLGSIIHPPEPNPSIPDRPYLVGLTGGIASGKTEIAKYLASLGYGYISYDLIGHKTYSTVGSPVYNQIVEYFGTTILNEETKQIDRSKLGKIVFGDRSKLDMLNKMVWPAINALVEQEIDKLKTKHDLIFLENALLIDNNQTHRVHQVWTAIIPPEEAVRRQIESRNLPREEAQRRVDAQLDNETRVKKSNAIFCSLWEPEFTQSQVRKCLEELKTKYLVS